MNPTRDSLRPPGMRFVTPGGTRGRLSIDFYRAPGIRITNEWFSVAGRRFRIGELSRLHVVRGSRDPLVTRSVVAAGVVLAGIGVALGYGGGLYRLSAATYLILAVAVLLPLALAALGNRLRPPGYELWGRYQGLNVLLFSCDQERQFGQVTRALLRAREVSRLGGATEPLADRGWAVPR